MQTIRKAGKFPALLAATGLLWAEPPLKSGVDVTAIDTTCKPCDDFWRFANGTWIDKNPIPARYSRWGTMNVMSEGNQERLRVILENASANGKPGTNEKRIGDLYAACMDTATIDKLGLSPIQADLDRIAKVSSTKELATVLLAFTNGRGTGPFQIIAREDIKNSKEVIGYVAAGLISLPTRDYYLENDDRSKKIREEYSKHVSQMMLLSGLPQAEASQAGKIVLDFEAQFAKVMLSNVERRNPDNTYHKMDLAKVSALVPTFNWAGMLAQWKVPASTPLVVSEPKLLAEVEKQFQTAPLDTWKTWLRWRLLDSSAASLSKPFADQDFAFGSTVLRGVKEQQPRWQLCTAAVDRSLGDALGNLFVQKHFPPQAKTRMNELVENLRATLREELEAAPWLDAETRGNAVKKLNAFQAKIGYPDRWRDYSNVKVDRKAYLLSLRSAGQAARQYNLNKIGKPVDRNDWGMTPPTVNAYYNSVKNEIAFPAGILQPPLFDMDADDAANYGAIGAVIGHEMGHGFDDQGSKFDAEGNLKMWWTPEDRKKFEARAECVITQFNTLDVGEGLRHNGRLVVGEALGDLGGLTLAFKAYKRSLRGKPQPPVIDGYTAEQRFFLAFARVWATDARPEARRLLLKTDPHPLGKFRANGTLMNMPEFHEAFQCKLGDPMVQVPEKRCRLW